MPETRPNTLLKSSNPLKGARSSTGCSTTNRSTWHPPFVLFSQICLPVSKYLSKYPNISLHCLHMAINLSNGVFSLFLWKIWAHLLRGKSNQRPTLSLVRSPGVQCEDCISCGLFEKGHINGLHQGEKSSKRIAETSKTGLRTFRRIIKTWNDIGNHHLGVRNGVRNKARMSVLGNYLNI